MYLYVMSDLLNKKQDSVSQEQKTADMVTKTADKAAAENAANRAAEERKARIRKMRGWLSPRDSEVDDFGPEDAALYYGEGHSGWNR